MQDRQPMAPHHMFLYFCFFIFTRFLFSILLSAVIPALIFSRASRAFSVATETPGKAKISKIAVNYICMRMSVRDSHLCIACRTNQVFPDPKEKFCFLNHLNKSKREWPVIKHKSWFWLQTLQVASSWLGDYRWCVADSWLYCWLAKMLKSFNNCKDTQPVSIYNL